MSFRAMYYAPAQPTLAPKARKPTKIVLIFYLRQRKSCLTLFLLLI
jgi:hypothetical protein